jgi:hypothetical protein
VIGPSSFLGDDTAVIGSKDSVAHVLWESNRGLALQRCVQARSARSHLRLLSHTRLDSPRLDSPRLDSPRLDSTPLDSTPLISTPLDIARMFFAKETARPFPRRGTSCRCTTRGPSLRTVPSLTAVMIAASPSALKSVAATLSKVGMKE